MPDCKHPKLEADTELFRDGEDELCLRGTCKDCSQQVELKGLTMTSFKSGPWDPEAEKDMQAYSYTMTVTSK